MKKDFLLLAVLFMMLTLSSCKYNDDDIWNTVNSLETRILNLEESCKQMNKNISAIQAIMNVCQDHDYITSVTPVIKGDITIGYTIAFKRVNPLRFIMEQTVLVLEMEVLQHR